jgi:hypothetical protein
MKRIILIIASITLLTGCQKSVSEKIVDKIESQKDSVINIKYITDFSWDNFYVFYGAYSDKTISNFIGAKYDGDEYYSDDTHFIFVKSGKVIHKEQFHRVDNKLLELRALNFEKEDIPHFSPDNAKFKVVKDTSYGDLGYILIPIK